MERFEKNGEMPNLTTSSLTTKMISRVVVFIHVILLQHAMSWGIIPRQIRHVQNQERVSWFIKGTLSFGAAAILKSDAASAVKGAVQSSSLADTKIAVETIVKARDATNDMDKMANGGDYSSIAKLLNSKTFGDLEVAFTTLVRSDAISSEDKLSLGTIKRYGTVADALIMIGGLGSELVQIHS